MKNITGRDALKERIAAALDPLHEGAVAYKPEGVAIIVLEVIPNGWAKVDGEWLEFDSVRPRAGE